MRDSHPSVPGVCDSYRKRQRNVTERTESTGKEKGRLVNGRGQGGGGPGRVRQEDQRNMTFVLQGQRSKER